MSEDISSDLQFFAFDGAEIRTVIEPDGSPWFVAADVCALLGHSNARRAVRDLLDDDQWKHVPAGRAERKVEFQPGRGGVYAGRDMPVVDESGLYGLILGSRVARAREFRRWVTREVLPALRQRGMYALPEVAREMAGLVRGAMVLLDALGLADVRRIQAQQRAGNFDAADELGEAVAHDSMRDLLGTLLHRLPPEVRDSPAIVTPETVALIESLGKIKSSEGFRAPKAMQVLSARALREGGRT